MNLTTVCHILKRGILQD